jgi:biotin transport system substrate-specific component
MTTATVRHLAAARLPAIGALAFVLLLAAASQVAIPLPGTPVPITLQPLVVVLAGLALGPAAAAASMVTYLAVGAAGLPVFAPVGAPGIARLLGPTGGYLLAYPAAAVVAGVLASRTEGRSGDGAPRTPHRVPRRLGAIVFGRRVIAAAAGIAVLYVGGVAQLAVLTGDIGRAVQLGVWPFVAFDLLKAIVAAALAGALTTRLGR